MHHRGADLFLRSVLRPVGDLGIGQRIEPVAHAAAGEQGREVGRGFEHRVEALGQFDGVDFVMRKVAARRGDIP